MLPTIDGSRVCLRPLNLNDSQDLFEIYGCQETMQFASDPPFESLETVYEMLASVEQLERKNESFEWGVILSLSGKLIGTCGMHSFSQTRQICEIGCMLNRGYWGNGLMHEALDLLFSYAIKIGLNYVLADIDTPNHRSIALFTKLGFTKNSKGQYGLSFQEVA